MAKTKPQRPKTSRVAEFPAPSSDPGAADTAVAAEELPEPQPPPKAAQKSGQSKQKERDFGPDPLPKIQEFFERCSGIRQQDWQARAKVKVYRLKPIYDMLIGSKRKYIRIYELGAPTEEQIKHDCGSGRYRLYLNFKTDGADHEKELASVEIDILDPAFPPNLPVGDWLNDEANREWRWARPLLEAREAEAAAKVANKNERAAASSSGNMLEAVQVLGELQDRAEERARERIDSGRPQTWDPAQQLATVVTAAKDIAGALKATPENPIPAFISEQMTAMRTELADARRRSDTLMDKLLDMARAPQPQQQNGLSAVKEIMQGIKDFLPTVRDLWPNAPEDIAERVVKSKMGPWQEFFAPVLPRLVDALAPIMPAMAAGLMGGNGPARPPGMPPQARLPNPAMPQPSPQSPPQAQHAPNLDEMLLNALTSDRDGGEFADSLVMLFGQQGQLMYRQAASLGEQGLLTLIQQRPVWNQLGPLQSKVPAFVHEFIEWGQEPQEEMAEGAEPPAAGEVVDLTGEATQ
jgi:hypothetical protein